MKESEMKMPLIIIVDDPAEMLALYHVFGSIRGMGEIHNFYRKLANASGDTVKRYGIDLKPHLDIYPVEQTRIADEWQDKTMQDLLNYKEEPPF